MFNDSNIDVVKENIKNAWTELLQIVRNFKESAKNMTDPRILGEQLQIIFRDESKLIINANVRRMTLDLLAVARNNLYFVCIGLGVGTTCGYFIGTWIARSYYPSPVMKAVACFNFREPDVSQHII